MGSVLMGLGLAALLFATGGAAAVVLGTVAGVLDLALAGSQVAQAFLYTREQELGLRASAFRPKEEYLVESVSYGDFALAAAAGLLSAIDFLEGPAKLLLRKEAKAGTAVLAEAEVAIAKVKADEPSVPDPVVGSGTGQTQPPAAVADPTGTANRSVEPKGIENPAYTNGLKQEPRLDPARKPREEDKPIPVRSTAPEDEAATQRALPKEKPEEPALAKKPAVKEQKAPQAQELNQTQPTKQPSGAQVAEQGRLTEDHGTQHIGTKPVASPKPPRVDPNTNHRCSGETAGTGGITDISGRRNLEDGSLDIRISGELKTPLERKASSTPNYNETLPTGSTIGLSDYEIAHLWGPGFGDEARDGMMYAPREVNQIFQNKGIEARLRELQALAAREGATIELTAQAISHPLKTWKGHEMLKEANYSFKVRFSDGTTRLIGEVNISVPPPGSGGKITVDVHGGSAGVWSLN